MDLELRGLVITALEAYRSLLFVFLILSFLQSLADLRLPDALRPAQSFLYDICDPFLRIFRGLIPGIRLGGMGLDLSPILAFISLQIITALVVRNWPA